MTSSDIDQRLKDLKRNKANRRLEEIESLLASYGFTCREGKKSHDTWSLGKHSLTLPRPHDKFMKVPYVSLAIRIIEAAAMEAQQEDEKERDDPSDA